MVGSYEPPVDISCWWLSLKVLFLRRNKVYDEQELGTRIKIKKEKKSTFPREDKKQKKRRQEKLKFTRKRAYYAKWIQQFVFLEFLICNSNTQSRKLGTSIIDGSFFEGSTKLTR